MYRNNERFSLIERTIHGALAACEKIHDEKIKQSKPPWTFDVCLSVHRYTSVEKKTN